MSGANNIDHRRQEGNRKQDVSRSHRQRKSLRFKYMAEEILICFALCLLSLITLDLQKIHRPTFACCLDQTILNFFFKIVQDYLEFFRKIQVTVHRPKILSKCLKNDIKPDFLVPRKRSFLDQAPHSVQ